MGTTTEENQRRKIISLASFINNGDGTTVIHDDDADAVVGGIALIGTTGNGTWAYSLDGTTFTAIGSVSRRVRPCCFLQTGTTGTLLRFTPNGANGGPATITYRAWDTTGGASTGRVDLSAPPALPAAQPPIAASPTPPRSPSPV